MTRELSPKTAQLVALLALGLFGWTTAASGQSLVQVFPDDRLAWNEVVCHIDRGVLREGSPQRRGKVQLTVSQERIFEGYSTSSFDLIYHVENEQLRRGNSAFSDDILFTLHNGQVFIGDSRFALDLVYTLRPDPLNPDLTGVFREDSISDFDRVCVLQGRFSTAELFSLLLAQGWL
jgi:hypothetical protein